MRSHEIHPVTFAVLLALLWLVKPETSSGFHILALKTLKDALPLPALSAPFRISGNIVEQIEVRPRDVTKASRATYDTAQPVERGLPSLSGAQQGTGARWKSKSPDCASAVTCSPMEGGRVMLLLKPCLRGCEMAPEA